MDTEAPTWLRWEEEARRRHADTPPIADRVGLSFAEEAHAMEAAVAGQGAAICSDVLVGSELADGRLVRISDVTIPGYGFYAVWRRDNLRADAARRFAVWLDEAWKT